jgi:hypothetical protein
MKLQVRTVTSSELSQASVSFYKQAEGAVMPVR